MNLKKSYAIELTQDQETFLKVRFRCPTDAELRNILQRIAVSLIDKQRESIIEVALKEELEKEKR